MSEPNCYGDGTVYRGQRSKDSEVRTLFTPGPWVVAEEAKIKHPEGTLIAQAQYWSDARLIAAAPDLYDAVCSVVERWDNPLHKFDAITNGVIDDLRAVLKKARGES